MSEQGRGGPGTRDPALYGLVLAELRRLRSSKGQFGPARLVEYPALYGLASQTEAGEAWHWLARMSDAEASASRYLQAARLSVFGRGEDVLERLTEAGTRLDRDQRTVRAWSDRGLAELAHRLVDASYLSGSRAVHFVDCSWVNDEASSTGDLALRIYWAGHRYMIDETIRVFIYGLEKAWNEEELIDSRKLMCEIQPNWRQIDPPRGAFELETGVQLRVPHPSSFDYGVMTLRFGKQSTQMVRIGNLPRRKDYVVRMSVFREGVTCWFDRPGEDGGRTGFDWGTPIEVHSTTTCGLADREST